MEDFLRRVIQAVIESFLIDETKKADILRNILGPKSTKEDK